MWRIATLLFGGFGGLCPILVDKAKDFIVGKGYGGFYGPDVQTAFLMFLFGSICFFLLGAIVALAHKETDHWKALVIGVSAPGLITAAAGSSADGANNTVVRLSARWQLGINSAYAQAPPTMPGGYQLNVAPGGASGCLACELKIFRSDGSLLSTAPLATGEGSKTVTVPPDADEIILWAPGTNSAVIPLDQFKAGQVGGELNLQVDRERNITNDLWRTFGNKSIQPYDFDVKVTPGM